MQPPIVMSIAGFDPSSGAGVTADLKTIAAHEMYGVACITALTVQTTTGVRRVQSLDPELVRDTLDALMDDSRPAAVKIGMLGSGEIAAAVAGRLSDRGLRIVLDPVIRSSSGAALLEEAGVEMLRSRLLPLADVVTPNMDEAAVLSGIQVADVGSMEEAGRMLVELGARNVVVTGGHLSEPIDVVVEGLPGGDVTVTRIAGEHVDTANTHGTGCAFSSALACGLARGDSLLHAVKAAKNYVAEGLRTSYRTGRGPGSVNHLFAFSQESRKP